MAVSTVRASIGANWATYDFEDGRLPGNVPFEQDDRDHDAWDATGRLDYAISPDTAIFGSVTRRERDYDLDVFDRDSEGWRYLAGANFDITSVIRGEVGLGYSTTEYDNAALSDTDGFSAAGRVEWFPTQLTTLTFDALRDTVDSDIALSSAIERTGFGFRIDHELRRDIILHGEAAYDQDEYEGIDRDDDRTRYNVGADWYLNRSVTFGAGYQHFSQESAGVSRDRDFDVNQVMFNVTFRR